MFMSERSLTGYDNHDVVTGQSDEEVYRYDAQTGALTRISSGENGSNDDGNDWLVVCRVIRGAPRLSGQPRYLAEDV